MDIQVYITLIGLYSRLRLPQSASKHPRRIRHQLQNYSAELKERKLSYGVFWSGLHFFSWRLGWRNYTIL